MQNDVQTDHVKTWVAIHIAAASVILFLIILATVVTFNGGDFNTAFVMAFTISLSLGGFLIVIFLTQTTQNLSEHYVARHLTRENFGTPKSIFLYAICMSVLVLLIWAKAVTNHSSN